MTTQNHLTDEMRDLLATLLIAEDPINLETAAVRSGMSLETAKISMNGLREAGYVRPTTMNKRIFWTIEDHPEVLAEVAIHVCTAYQRHSAKMHEAHAAHAAQHEHDVRH